MPKALGKKMDPGLNTKQTPRQKWDSSIPKITKAKKVLKSGSSARVTV
jgi:hypothetical protein